MSNGMLSSTFRVGRRYRSSIELPLTSIEQGAAQIEARWEPDVPRRLTKAELRDYRRGRDELLAEAARLLGGAVAIVEV
jgi:hypothetical protein